MKTVFPKMVVSVSLPLHIVTKYASSVTYFPAASAVDPGESLAPLSFLRFGPPESSSTSSSDDAWAERNNVFV